MAVKDFIGVIEIPVYSIIMILHGLQQVTEARISGFYCKTQQTMLQDCILSSTENETKQKLNKIQADINYRRVLHSQ